jgi:Antitoxin MazE-like
MPTSSKSVKSRDKVRAHRARLRRRGLRPIQIWVPDVRSRTFAREAHRQSLLIGTHKREREEQDFVDAVSEWPSE